MCNIWVAGHEVSTEVHYPCFAVLGGVLQGGADHPSLLAVCQALHQILGHGSVRKYEPKWVMLTGQHYVNVAHGRVALADRPVFITEGI